MTGIYKITNKTTKTVYIGKSKNIKYRWSEHRYELDKNIHSNPHLQNAWNKYGPEDFIFEIVELCKFSELDEKEIFWINQYGGSESTCNYNVLNGGEGGAGNSEWRKKISAKVKQHYDNGDYSSRGKGQLVWIKKDNIQKKIHREQIQNYLDRGWVLGRLSFPLEIRYKFRKVGVQNGFYGKHHTEETKQKMRKKHNISVESLKKISETVSRRTRLLKWINNGTENKRVNENLLQSWLNRGWKVGRLPVPQISKTLKSYFRNNPEKRHWGANSNKKY